MREREEHLFEVLDNLIRIKHECSSSIFSECGLSDITVRQIAYLKTIDEQGEVTFSRLARDHEELKTHDHRDDQQICPDGVCIP